MAQYSGPVTKISQTVPVPSAPPKGKKIVFLNQQGVPSVGVIGSGVEAAAKAVGWQYSEETYDAANPATLQAAFNSALIQKANVVAVVGSDPATFGVSTLAKFKQAGVPIVAASEASLPPGGPLVGPVGGPTQYQTMGKALAAQFVVSSGGKGNLLLADVVGIPIHAIMFAAAKSEVKALCPSCGVKDATITLAQLGAGQANAAVTAALRSNPTYKYVMYGDGDFADGLPAAMQSAGLTGITTIGVNMVAGEQTGVRSGSEVWTGVSLLAIGYAQMDAAIRAIEKVPPTNNNDNLPFQVLTKATIGSTNIWNEPSDGLQQYLKLWHVSS